MKSTIIDQEILEQINQFNTQSIDSLLDELVQKQEMWYRTQIEAVVKEKGFKDIEEVLNNPHHDIICKRIGDTVEIQLVQIRNRRRIKITPDIDLIN